MCSEKGREAGREGDKKEKEKDRRGGGEREDLFLLTTRHGTSTLHRE